MTDILARLLGASIQMAPKIQRMLLKISMQYAVCTQ
uniref:Uncharacterized protein n=1 Tax=Arundo donax TaxID=35708 RepID=A0A0A8XTQ3_ARUDO